MDAWSNKTFSIQEKIQEKAKLDGEYVKKESFAFDCQCFLKTILRVLRSDDIID